MIGAAAAASEMGDALELAKVHWRLQVYRHQSTSQSE